jgi:hypothetical protein
VTDATDYAEAQPDPQPSTAMRWVFAESWPGEAPPAWGMGEADSGGATGGDGETAGAGDTPGDGAALLGADGGSG